MDEPLRMIWLALYALLCGGVVFVWRAYRTHPHWLHMRLMGGGYLLLAGLDVFAIVWLKVNLFTPYAAISLVSFVLVAVALIQMLSEFVGRKPTHWVCQRVPGKWEEIETKL